MFHHNRQLGNEQIPLAGRSPGPPALTRLPQELFSGSGPSRFRPLFAQPGTLVLLRNEGHVLRHEHPPLPGRSAPFQAQKGGIWDPQFPTGEAVHLCPAEAWLGNGKTGPLSHPACPQVPRGAPAPPLPHISLWAAGGKGTLWRCQATGGSAQEPRPLPSTLFLRGRPIGWEGPLYRAPMSSDICQRGNSTSVPFSVPVLGPGDKQARL